MPWGNHRGRFLADVPTDYLGWLTRNCHDERWSWLVAAARRQLDRRARAAEYARESHQASEQGEAMADLAEELAEWWRGLVLDYHPDRGGTVEAMAALNEARDRLQRILKP